MIWATVTAIVPGITAATMQALPRIVVSRTRCTLHPPERDITNHGVLIWKIQKYHYPAMKQRRMVILPVRAVIHERRLQ